MKYINIIELRNFIKSSSFFLSVNEDENDNFLCLTDIPELVKIVDVLSYCIDTKRLVSQIDNLGDYKYLKLYTPNIKNRKELFELLSPNIKNRLISFNKRDIDIDDKKIEFNEIIIDLVSDKIATLDDWFRVFKNNNEDKPYIHIEKITFNLNKVLKGE